MERYFGRTVFSSPVKGNYFAPLLYFKCNICLLIHKPVFTGCGHHYLLDIRIFYTLLKPMELSLTWTTQPREWSGPKGGLLPLVSTLLKLKWTLWWPRSPAGISRLLKIRDMRISISWFLLVENLLSLGIIKKILQLDLHRFFSKLI